MMKVRTGKAVNVSEVTLKTLSVELKSLTLNGKQMTLSVFRQLEKERLIDHRTVEFRGTPWGRVNYYFDDCKNMDPHHHLHLVWQKGNELRRSCEESSYEGRFDNYDWEAVRSYYLAHRLSKGEELLPGQKDFMRKQHQSLFNWRADDEVSKTELNRILSDLHLISTFSRLSEITGIDKWELLKDPQLAVSKADEWNKTQYQKFKDLFDLLKQLPQLFIAI